MKRMRTVKIAAIVLVMSTGLFVSYRMVTRSSESVVLDRNASGTAASAPSLSHAPIQWAEKLKEFVAQDGHASGTSAAGMVAGAASSGGEVNVTRFVAQSLFGKMKGLDQNSQNPFQNFDPNDAESQKIIQDALAELRSGSSTLFSDAVASNEIKISNDTSRDTERVYFESVGNISRNRLGDARFKRSADETIGDIQGSCSGDTATMQLHKDLSGAYAAAADDYLAMKAPKDIVSLHTRIIGYLRKTSAIYRAIATCADDPIKGYLAAQAFSQEILHAGEIQLEINEHAKALGF